MTRVRRAQCWVRMILSSLPGLDAYEAFYPQLKLWAIACRPSRDC
jgi:hypothetical protein